MAISPRLIRRRIKSVQNTRKITKAMEMVAAAKMRRAVDAALRTRAYAQLAWKMIGALQGTVDEEVHPLLRVASSLERSASRILYIVMASDRGLCGGFNAQLFKMLLEDVREHASDPSCVRFVSIGKKAEQFLRRKGWNLEASFVDVAVAPKVAELRPISQIAIDAFTRGEVDEVRLVFTDFVSSLRQQPVARTLLPLQRIAEIGIGEPEEALNTQEETIVQEFLFEPDPKLVLDAMLPRLTELQVYQSYLETGASEHSARMFAMRSASDAASDMIQSLTLSLNRARQAMITSEIAEISAGRAALGN
ncbi:MAG: ATP synthase F1 subunit gamma [Candidatus Uhrbacteria bacterium]